MYLSTTERAGRALPRPKHSRRNLSVTVSNLELALPHPGATMTLDAILPRLNPCETAAYAIVADGVRSGAYVVFFEAEPRPFPHRELMICRL